MNSRHIIDNLALIFVVLVVSIGLGWSFYSSVFSTAGERADKAIANQIEACHRQLARSEIFQAFAREAAAARRAQAAAEAKVGNNVEAQNNLATAQRYESFARQWDSLTVKNCQEQYGVS